MKRGRKPSNAAIVTGQVFIRDAGEAPSKDGRHLVMVAGLLALPPGIDLPMEHQFVVSGSGDDEAVFLTILRSGSTDRTEEARGETIGSMLTHPIWRV